MSDSVLDILGIESRVSLRPESTDPILKPLEGEADAGKYQLQGEIARGGVGAVLKGYDTHLGRDVAVKLLHDDYVGNPDVLQRFVEEAQIGGQLQHPGIVPVYDLGLQGDRPFFSMKLVKGRTLASLLEEKANRRKLLAIFEQVCHTMAYAHTRSVIHRDLKPANVMVGAFGEVQVVDWGMGKVLGKGGIADETRAQLSVIATVRSEKPGSQSIVGSVMGTPAYMPPEQAMGDVERMDERSDVFSLGAVLCEILTGLPPYVGEGLIQQAAQADLTKCRERIDNCDADEELKQLVRQCLSPAHQARPKDANELADRIGKHLTSVEERAQQAHVEAAEEHVKAHEARRAQKLTLGLAASVLLTLAVGGGGWWWLQTDKAQRQAQAGKAVQAALDDARVAYGRADWEAAHADAKRAHALASDASPSVQEDVATFLADVKRQHQEATDRARRLEDELKMLAVLEGIPIPPDDTAGRAIDIYGKPDCRRRDRAYRTAFAKFGLTLDELQIRSMTRPELWAAALDDWAWAAGVIENTELRTRLLDVAMAIDPDATRAELRAWRKHGEGLRKLDARTFPPMTASLYAEILGNNGDTAAAFATLHAAQRRHPDSFPLALRLALRHWGAMQLEAALRFASVAAALRPQSANAAGLKGELLFRLERYPEAETVLVRATRVGQELGYAWHMLGHVLDHTHREKEALAAFRKAVRLSPDDAGACTCLGSALRRHGELEEAEKWHRRATELDPTGAWPFNNHGNSLISLRRFKEAEAAFRKAISLGGSHLMANANLAHLLVMQNKRKEARDVCEAALAIDVNQLDSRAAPGLVNVGAVLCDALRQYKRAIVAFDRALELDPSDSDARRNAKGNLAVAHANIANVHMDKGQFKEAEEALRKGIAAHPTAQAHGNLAWIFLNVERFDEAIVEARKALALDPGYAHGKRNLATAYVKLFAKFAALKRKVETDPAAVAKTLTSWKRDPGPDLTDKQRKLWTEVDALRKRAEAAAK